MSLSTQHSTAAQSIFRLNALQHVGTELDQTVTLRIIHPGAWIWITGVLTAIAGLVVWGVYGTLMQTVYAMGIIIPANSQVISVASASGGTVTAVTVQPDQRVKKGDILARINNPLLSEAIRHAQMVHTANSAALSAFLPEYQKQADALLTQLGSRSRQLTQSITNNKESVRALHDLLFAKKNLFKQGYLSRVDYEKSRMEYFLTNEKLSALKNELTEIGIVFDKNMQILNDKKDQLTRQYTNSLHQLAQSRTELALGSSITSPADGTLTGVYLTQGSRTNPHQPAFTLVTHSTNGPMEVLTFVNAAEGKKLSRSMRALVLPSNLSAYKHGYLMATVSKVSDYPVTRETAMLYLGNQALVDTFFKTGAPFLVTLTLIPGKALGGVKWTSHSPTQHLIASGTMTNVKIITGQYAPFKLLMK